MSCIQLNVSQKTIARKMVPSGLSTYILLRILFRHSWTLGSSSVTSLQL